MYYFIFFPLLGGAIGWVTNYLAIKFLFRPRNPWRIGTLESRSHSPPATRAGCGGGGSGAGELLPQAQIAAARTPDIRRNMAELAGDCCQAGGIISGAQAFPRALRTALAQQVAKLLTGKSEHVG